MKKPALHVEVNFTPFQIDEMQLKDRTVVIIDVLRSCTTISMALQNGAKEIIPAKNIETAMRISTGLDSAVTLRGGERNGKMIEGFNLGNSPHEYTEAAVNGKTIILLTTNGTKVMAGSRLARRAFLASFVNLSAVVLSLREIGDSFTIICSGKESRFSLEDAVCAGRIVNALGAHKDVQLALDDGATAASGLDKAFGKNIPKMLHQCEHGQYLASIGFERDLDLCGKIDSIPVVPSLAGGVFKKWKPLAITLAVPAPAVKSTASKSSSNKK
ncbi:MAG TPA: 2-phosphosulfolactate phosphatase [Bacteroidota bacterium]|nr:2-phosphosulfolactate phosphatase [Bacteroidota bacterium]